ncbi:uncharacterized protein LTR77_002415 [Saxophila tyrrhenica]|uniref:Peptidase M20 dimerisation domain-containing protein n=1 Tax=Saxophila tyrrhenica TaxID=1690608 RepID=A0AAV9PJ47_9PEZI|nr:hypothetical protein LTR77_002415 [Saxophila tyrrhenica]
MVEVEQVRSPASSGAIKTRLRDFLLPPLPANLTPYLYEYSMEQHSSGVQHSTADDFVMVEHATQGGTKAKESYLDAISSAVEGISDELRTISLDIHDHPELQYKEFHAHQILTDYLRNQEGWKVTPSAYDIKTAFVAVFDSGREGPVVSFNAEYDALAGIGHACGHNLIAIVSLGAALATAELLRQKDIGGRVVLFGTPAEEGGGGKKRLLDAGAYKDNQVDISLITHPGISPDAALVRTAAYSALKVEFFGKEAHAAARPWDGINALDALIIAYNSISVLRQQTQAGDIIQGQITNGGLRPNIIHAYAAGRFVVRSSSKKRLEALVKRVTACFEAGAHATGAELKVTPGMSYSDHVPNRALGRQYRQSFNRLGGRIPTEELDILDAVTQASTDQGNISHAYPSISPNFWIRSESDGGEQLGGPHTPDFEKAARSEESHELAKRAAKALAATAVGVLTDPDLLADAKKEFEDMVETEGRA